MKNLASTRKQILAPYEPLITTKQEQIQVEMKWMSTLGQPRRAGAGVAGRISRYSSGQHRSSTALPERLERLERCWRSPRIQQPPATLLNLPAYTPKAVIATARRLMSFSTCYIQSCGNHPCYRKSPIWDLEKVLHYSERRTNFLQQRKRSFLGEKVVILT